MNKIKVLCLSIWYPLSMSRYFEKAFRHNPNIDLKTTGPYTANWIPWMGTGMDLPMKYAIPPDVPLPFPPNVSMVSYDLVKAQLNDWTPDLIVAIDAGINWNAKPHDGMSVTIGTDPHVLNDFGYIHARKISDKFFNMQRCYSEPSDIYLPYAYSSYDHYKTNSEKDLDAILIGMPYTHVPRAQWIEELKQRGVGVYTENGPVFDEYRELANRAKIGLNWSSMNDLNARFFETPAFGLPLVSNRVPDAHLYLTEDVHWLGFDTIGQAIEQVIFLKDHPDVAEEMGRKAREAIAPHTYDARVEQLLKDCGF